MADIGVLVYTAKDTFEAAELIALLEAQGIPAYTKELGAGQIFKAYTGFSNMGTEIYVPAAAAEAAGMIIEGGMDR